MKIDWAALGSVFGVSLVVTVALVGLFTLGIVGLSQRSPAPAAGGEAAAADATTPQGTAARGGAGSGGAMALVGAYTCFALCVAAVGYGIYLIVA
ncbi:hypothetical protein ACIQNU_07855 [Streptomyces sp. NPDC091292]|uniref:hypothetical protein n=1 Tax=Streptomyces sp. NPDC091292 TaxID=3365991 RepID=UPI003815DFCD